MSKKNSSWFTPYVLNPHNIEKLVDPSVPGVYVLGQLGPDKKVVVKHIKSSDNVKADLKKNLGQYHIFMYKPFKRLFRENRRIIIEQQPLALKFV